MTEGSIKLRRWRAVVSFIVTAITVCLWLGGTFLVPMPSAAGMEDAGNGDGPASGTPVAAAATRNDLLDSDPSEAASINDDPLDGDPLDGTPADDDPGAPVDETQLEIVRSARPHDEPETLVIYDDDPQTEWVPHADAGETWVWLDLGRERRLSEVRWLAKGTGTVEIAVSNDRQRWQDVESVEVSRGWQGVELHDDARYVRLTLLPVDEGGAFPAIGEAAVYGADGADQQRPVSSAQRAGDSRRRDSTRKSRGDTKSASAQKTEDSASSGGEEGRKEPRAAGRVRTSAEPGETECRDGDRCTSRAGDVSVESDCEREGTCTIDVRVDGGTAICDATGGGETKAGKGEGKRGGSAGRCEAVANGGAVAVGDVNP